jgi:hypothetical protein
MLHPGAAIDEEQLTRFMQDQAMPNSPWDDVRAPSTKFYHPLAFWFVQDHIDGARDQVQQLVAARMHLPQRRMEVSGTLRVNETYEPVVSPLT